MDAIVRWVLSPDVDSLGAVIDACAARLHDVVAARYPRVRPPPSAELVDLHASSKMIALLSLMHGWVAGEPPEQVDEMLRSRAVPESRRLVGHTDRYTVWENDIISDLDMRLVAVFNVGGASVETYYGKVAIDVPEDERHT